MKNLARLGLVLAVPALALFNACGKEDNLHSPALIEFPHSFPEAPRVLESQVAPVWTAGHALAVTEAHIFVTDRDNRELVRLDRHTLKRDASLSVGARPEQVIVGDDGAVFVSLRSGEVLRVSPELVIEARAKLGTEVFGIALSPDATTLYATLPLEHELHTLDVMDLSEVAAPITVLDTPRGVSASPNGWVMVVHQFAGALQIATDQYNRPIDTVAETQLRIGNPADHIEGFRLNGLQSARALATVVSPEDGSAYIAHITASPGTEQDFLNATLAPVTSDASAASDGYGSSVPSASFPIPTRPVEVTVTATDAFGTPEIVESDFPVQDTVTGEPMVHLIEQPSDVAHHPSWSLLFVAGYGSDNVLVLSTAEGDPMRSPLSVIDVGHAPRGIAFSPDGETAYVLNEHELTVSVIDLSPFFSLSIMEDGRTVFASSGDSGVSVNTATPAGFAERPNGEAPDMGFMSTGDPTPDSPRVRPFRLEADEAVAYGVDPLPEAVRNGARIFTFARNDRLSHAGEFACATCHFEGTEDKLVWFISDGPRQTPALAGRLAGTAPFNWGGTKDDLKSNMVQTIDRMGGKGLSKSELADLEQFLLFGLKAPDNPYLAEDGQLTAEQLAGKAIFESTEAGCASCHRPDQNFTDGLIHDVGTASKAELTRFEIDRAINPDLTEPWRLNTPTLKGLFYTAPYLHDGSAKTLEEALDRTAETMGKTSHLTDVEKQQLIAYLLTL